MLARNCLGILFLMLLFQNHSQAQYFTFIQDIKPQTKENQKYLINAWAGSFINPQYLEFDLDGDNINDLVVFDRADNKITTFKAYNIGPRLVYLHQPNWVDVFPLIRNWMVFRDYNCDGLLDIYCSGNGNVMLYKNTGTIGAPAFTLVTSMMLATYSFGMASNLYIYSTDIPVIEDLDGDGDIDIAGFDLLYINQMNYFKNFSKERYGVCDSLSYFQVDLCWGKFYENNTSNDVYGLQDDCATPRAIGLLPRPPKSNEVPNTERIQHVGATSLVWDYDNDNDLDMLLGDVSYNNMVLLVNGNTKDSTVFTQKDTLFPKYNTPINVAIFPAAFRFDVDGDAKKDLLIAPNDPINSTRLNQYWHYRNVGTTKDSFQLQNTNFMVDDMITQEYWTTPTAFDYDADGDLDLVLSTSFSQNSYSKLVLYTNTGTSQAPSFELTDTNYLDFDQFYFRSLYPSFADLNSDGKTDFSFGTRDGKVYIMYNNTPTGTAIQTFGAIDSSLNVDVMGSDNITPEFAYLNGDSLIDMVCGNKQGTLFLYYNTGTASQPSFTMQQSNWGQVNVTGVFAGFSTPRLGDLNGDSRLDLVVGNLDGYLFFYKDVLATAQGGKFDASLSNFVVSYSRPYVDILIGGKASPCIFPLDTGALPDLIVGNRKGGLQAFRNITNTTNINPSKAMLWNMKVFPNPASNEVMLQLGEVYKKCNIQIIDIHGRQVMQQNAKYVQQVQLPTQNLPNGLYLIKVETENGWNTAKVSIQH